MSINKYLPWFPIEVGRCGLGFGLLVKQMGGSAALGANSDITVRLSPSRERLLISLNIKSTLSGGGNSKLVNNGATKP